MVRARECEVGFQQQLAPCECCLCLNYISFSSHLIFTAAFQTQLCVSFLGRKKTQSSLVSLLKISDVCSWISYAILFWSGSLKGDTKTFFFSLITFGARFHKCSFNAYSVLWNVLGEIRDN